MCDFAETYHVFDYRSLPAMLAAKLAVGLRNTSRIKVKVSGLIVTPDIFLLASIFDVVNLLLWSRTEDAEKNRNRPTEISKWLRQDYSEPDLDARKNIVFDFAEDYEAARERLLEG